MKVKYGINFAQLSMTICVKIIIKNLGETESGRENGEKKSKRRFI